MFYASAGVPTTFVESRCSVDDIVVVSEFRIYENMIVQEIGFSNSIGSDSEVEALLKEIFTFPGKDFYDYSSYIAEYLVNGPDLHGILYPSIVSQNDDHNVALKPTYVDGSVHFVNASAYKVTRVEDKHKYSVDEIDFGVREENFVQWKGRKKQWVINKNGQELKMKFTGWGYDAYDEKGLLVDPI